MPSLSNVPDLILINAKVYTVNETQPLANAVAAEALTSILITINRHHGVEGSGIVITGEPTK